MTPLARHSKSYFRREIENFGWKFGLEGSKFDITFVQEICDLFLAGRSEPVSSCPSPNFQKTLTRGNRTCDFRHARRNFVPSTNWIHDVFVKA